MSKRTNIILTSAMMGIATAACAFCVAQSANAAETSTASGVTTTVNSSAVDSETSIGGGALDSTSVKPSGNIVPSKSSETAKTALTTQAADLNNSTYSNKNSITDRSVTSSDDSSSSSTAPTNKTSSTIVTSEDASSSTDSQKSDDIVWEDSDFNIYYDSELGKMIGGRKNIEHPAENGKPAYTENVDDEGFSPQGFAKLKKSRHVVIPEGIQAIHEHAFAGRASGNPDNFIDTLVLPKSLKVIEYGAFAYNTIRGTVEIPEGVISIHSGAFIGNKIEKVVFKSVLNGSGKINSKDSREYYLSGIGSRAFQANKIKEIVVPGNLADFMFLFDKSNPNQPDPGPFDNQDLGTKTIEVGEAFEYPIAIHQSGNNQEKIYGYGGFIENSTPTLIANSSYFELKNGKYVAKKVGTIQGQWIEYDLRNSENSPIGAAIFKYEILSKGSLCTVTFNNGDKVISSIRVKKGQSVAKGAVNDDQMPVDPVKDGYKFAGWYTQKDGKGDKFTADTVVNSNTNVYASYASNAPKPPAPAPIPTPVPMPTPTPDTTPDTDEEQTPAPDSTSITDFVPSHVQEYTKNQDYSFDVKKQDEAPLKMQIQANSAKHLPETGSSVTMAMNSLFASVFAGIFVLVGARKSRSSYSKHARKN